MNAKEAADISEFFEYFLTRDERIYVLIMEEIIKAARTGARRVTLSSTSLRMEDEDGMSCDSAMFQAMKRQVPSLVAEGYRVKIEMDHFGSDESYFLIFWGREHPEEKETKEDDGMPD